MFKVYKQRNPEISIYLRAEGSALRIVALQDGWAYDPAETGFYVECDGIGYPSHIVRRLNTEQEAQKYCDNANQYDDMKFYTWFEYTSEESNV